jgi:excisionase family DNA binding protein
MEQNGSGPQEPKPTRSPLEILANIKREDLKEIEAAKLEGRQPILKEHSSTNSKVVLFPTKPDEVMKIKAPGVEGVASTDDSQPLMKSAEAANLLGLSVKGLRNLASAGKIPHYKLFGQNRFKKSELMGLLVKVEIKSTI